MPIQAYKEAVFNLIEDLRKEEIDCRRYSDVFDEAGNQYVNFVQEGGGVLGLALVGYTYVLEEMGIRFLGLGGTSAGSINTLLMADAGTPDEAKSMRVLEKVAVKPFMDFVDGGSDARDLVGSLSKGWNSKIFHGLRNLPELFRNWGINPGHEFERWLKDTLVHKNYQELYDNLHRLPGDLILKDNLGHERYRLTVDDLDIKIAIVAADMTTQSKVDFPAMADLYFEDPHQVNPAEFVRASMSIPGFFEPKRVSLEWAHQGSEKVQEERRRDWRRRADFTGKIPREILFADGGLMSNFPIDLFHGDNQIPNRPTFGVKLGIDRNSAHEPNGIISFTAQLLDGIRNLRDFEFLRNNPEYKDLVEYIQVDGFDWLDFSISEEQKVALFKRGAEAAARFLRRFNWRKYKDTLNRNLLHRIKPAMWELSELRDIDEILQVFGIRDDDPLLKKIEELRSRKEKYNVLWIDDAFTYALPVAILDQLHMDSIICRSSLDAFAILRERNVGNKNPRNRIDLILTDVTRQEGNEPEGMRGITFAEQLLLSPGFADLPVIVYAHERAELEVKYLKQTGKELPANIKNTRGLNTWTHKHLIAEAVNCVWREEGGGVS